MIVKRPSAERGHANHGWLDSYHSFSFADYHDPAFMGFRSLRVINEDHIAPGAGFPTHSHRDMEIVTYVIDGALSHEDSLGNGSTIRHGDIQRMSAGSGIRHSEFNGSKTEPVHLLQLWIETTARGIEPDYEETCFTDHIQPNALNLIAQPGGGEGTVHINQDARVWMATLGKDTSVDWQPGVDRYGWLQVVRGELRASKVTLSAGDGAAVSNEATLEITATADTELLLFGLG